MQQDVNVNDWLSESQDVIVVRNLTTVMFVADSNNMQPDSSATAYGSGHAQSSLIPPQSKAGATQINMVVSSLPSSSASSSFSYQLKHPY